MQTPGSALIGACLHRLALGAPALAALLFLAHLGASRTTAAAEPPLNLVRLRTEPGESLRMVLRRGGIRLADANGAAFALGGVLDPDHPPVGLLLSARVERTEEGAELRLVSLEVARQGEVAVRLTRAADESWRLAQEASLGGGDEILQEAPVVVQGPMEAVLYGDPAVADDGPLILQAARLFARKLDLTRDIALGDRVRLVLTRKLGGDGRVLGDGSLLFAEIDTREGAVRIYRHRRIADGASEYMDDSGVALDHALLRTPLDRPRVTSGFGMRLHPLLGYTRLHRGIDLGAPEGSAVIAAGDGMVEEVRWAGDAGRRVKLRHSPGLETVYAHLSAWAPGLSSGRAVRQGQVIGYVGATGLTTGPHLHYEVLVSGQPVDPRGQLAAETRPLVGAERSAFEAEKLAMTQVLRANSVGAPAIRLGQNGSLSAP